jgi:dihydrolipoamide dehydrogenase
VTLVEVLPRLVPGVDRQVSDVLARSFKKRGIAVHTDARLSSIEGTRELEVGFVVEGTVNTITVDQVIVSVGRRPRTERIGLEGSGIELETSGHIRVDPNMRTTVEGIYAVGDVVNTPQLAHVGYAEAIVAIKTILGEDPEPVDYDKVPWGIYCHPEVAFAGLTEEQAIDRGLDVETSVHRFGANGRALIIGESEGLVKIVSQRDGPILGVHIVGPWATELIAEGYLAVNWEATAAEVGALIHPHPTLSELFGESALALTGRTFNG